MDKVGPTWSEFQRPYALQVTVEHQDAFRGFAKLAHTHGLSERHGQEAELLRSTFEAARDYYEGQGFPAADVELIMKALNSYELLAFHLNDDSPLDHLAKDEDSDGLLRYRDDSLAALDPSFDDSGLAADLHRVLG